MIELVNLLKRWAELQPGENNPDDLAVTLESLNYDLSGVYPQIQWKVQQAIVARGWSFDLKYNSHFRAYHATVDFRDNVGTFDNPAEALLVAYVKALEAKGD